MLAAIAQAHHAVEGNVTDIVNKHPSEWNFDIKFDHWMNKEDDQERSHKREKREKKRWFRF